MSSGEPVKVKCTLVGHCLSSILQEEALPRPSLGILAAGDPALREAWAGGLLGILFAVGQRFFHQLFLSLALACFSQCCSLTHNISSPVY